MVAQEGWYDLYEIKKILALQRVFGNDNVAQIRSKGENRRYENLHQRSKKINLIYRETTSHKDVGGESGSSPDLLKLNIKRDLETFLANGSVADPCTVCFSMHCGNHFIPMVLRVHEGKMEILYVDTLPGSYDNYIEAALQGARAAAETLQLECQKPIAIKKPQGDTNSCGPLTTLVNGMIDENKSLESQEKAISEAVDHGINNKQELRAYHSAVMEGGTMPAVQDEPWTHEIDFSKMTDDDVQNYINTWKADIRGKIEYNQPVTELEKEEFAEKNKNIAVDWQRVDNDRKMNREAQERLLQDPRLSSVEAFRGAASQQYANNLQKVENLRALKLAQPWLPEQLKKEGQNKKESKDKVAVQEKDKLKGAKEQPAEGNAHNSLGNDQQKEMIEPPRQGVEPKKFSIPEGVELEVGTASKWLWGLKEEKNKKVRKAFIDSCNDVLVPDFGSSITEVEFTESKGEHKITVTTEKAKQESRYDIYVTPSGLATEALVPEVYTVMAVAVKKGLAEGVQTQAVEISKTGTYPSPEKEKEMYFGVGKALANEGLVPRFPAGSSSEFMKEFVSTLSSDQMNKLRESVDTLVTSGVRDADMIALRDAFPFSASKLPEEQKKDDSQQQASVGFQLKK